MVVIHAVSETVFRFKKYITNETYMFRECSIIVIHGEKKGKHVLTIFFINLTFLYRWHSPSLSPLPLLHNILYPPPSSPLPKALSVSPAAYCLHFLFLKLLLWMVTCKKRDIEIVTWRYRNPKFWWIPCTLGTSRIHLKNFCWLYWPSST